MDTRVVVAGGQGGGYNSNGATGGLFVGLEQCCVSPVVVAQSAKDKFVPELHTHTHIDTQGQL